MDDRSDFIPELPHNGDNENDLREIAEITHNLVSLQAISPYSTEESLIVAEFNKPDLSHEERMELIKLADKCGDKKSHHTLFLVIIIAVSGLVSVYLRIKAVNSK